MHISEINIYPIKSLKGISVKAATVEARGLRYDRRWMLTYPDGMFFTQREHPRMALISVAIGETGLVLSMGGLADLDVPFESDGCKRQKVTVWRSLCDAVVYPDALNEWLSDAIGTACQLVYMPDDTRRSVNERFDSGDDIVSFADGYPLLVISEASLADLNGRLQDSAAGRLPAFRPLPMNRFRPNLVVSGTSAYAEDDWERIRIGDVVFRSTKPCERCVITTVDQARGEFAGKDPLKTLASYRMARDVMPERCELLGMADTAVLFGQNLIGESVGVTIRVRDGVEVVEAF